MFNDPQVLAAIVGSIGAIFASLIAAIAAALIGQKVIERKKLEEKLNRAILDIHFLLEVEKRHGDLNVQRGSTSNIRTVRKYVKDQRGMTWSGRFTTGREGRGVAA